MNGSKWIQALLCVLVLIVLLFIFILLDLSWAGNRTLSLGEVWAALMGDGTWGTNQIVNAQNLPRIAMGVFVGAGLAITGGVMQAVFRNPLADPYILGLSSGASWDPPWRSSSGCPSSRCPRPSRSWRSSSAC